MAEVIWAEPALNDLDAIADYIALDNPEAARRLVQKIFQHVVHLENHPRLGSKPEELKGWRYRQIVETAVSYLLPGRFWTSLDTSRHTIRAPAQTRTSWRSRAAVMNYIPGSSAEGP
jgi:plasmid stabilization system protein ParE